MRVSPRRLLRGQPQANHGKCDGHRGQHSIRRTATDALQKAQAGERRSLVQKEVLLVDSVSGIQSTDASCHMHALRCDLLGQIGKARASTLKIVASKDRQISAWVGGVFCHQLDGHCTPVAMRPYDTAACVHAHICEVLACLTLSSVHAQARCWRLCRPGKRSSSHTKTMMKKAQRWCRSSIFSLCLERCLLPLKSSGAGFIQNIFLPAAEVALPRGYSHVKTNPL